MTEKPTEKLRVALNRIRAHGKDILVRALKTAIQSFLAALPVSAELIQGGKAAWKAALISACAAGISAYMNVLIAVLDSSETEKED